MKISSFYLNDISEYDNFIEKFVNDIDMNFYGTGYNSLNLGRFIKYFRTELVKYINLKYDKKLKIIITMPRSESMLLDKTIHNTDEIIQIYLSYENVKNILNGVYNHYPDYVSEIIEQIDTIINSEPAHEFNEYLIIQMDNLIQICKNELLLSYSKSFIINNLKQPTAWVKMARQSSVFKDYYQFYQINKMENKNYFLAFLKKLYIEIYTT
jgi:hypothetical protein